MKISKQAAFQGIKQLFSIPYIYLAHGFRLPQGSYCSKVLYKLPFEGEWTVINGSCDKDFSHSWAIPTQRYAYDFVVMDDDGKTHQDNGTELTSYGCYGKNVLAPADGVVVEIGNNCADEEPFEDGAMKVTANDIRGNYILMKHARKEYSFVGHLQPQSITVKTGQKVHQGEVIAKCGNSGHTSEPHLHFHLQDGIGFFTSAGIPITFQDIVVSEKQGYSKYDKRIVPDFQEPTTAKIKISRGQEVGNDHN